MIPLALAVIVWCIVVVVRKTKNDDGPILRRYGLLVVAALFVIFGSMLATSPVDANDPSAQCGASAADAADLPPDVTPDISGRSCRELGRQSVRQAEIALLLGPLLGVVVAVRTRRYVEAG